MIMCVKKMKSQLPCLQLLTKKNIRKGLKKELLSDLDVVKAVIECTFNLLKGNVPLSEQQKKSLKKYERHIKYLSDIKKPIKVKQRDLINQNGNGFLPLILGPALALLTKLF